MGKLPKTFPFYYPKSSHYYPKCPHPFPKLSHYYPKLPMGKSTYSIFEFYLQMIKDIEKIKKWEEEGLDHTQIAEKLGVTRKTVYNRLQSDGETKSNEEASQPNTKTPEPSFGLPDILKDLKISLEHTEEGTTQYRMLKKLIDEVKEAEKEIAAFSQEERTEIYSNGHKNGVDVQQQADQSIIDQLEETSEYIIDKLEGQLGEVRAINTELINNNNGMVETIEKQNGTIGENGQFIETLNNKIRTQREEISKFEKEQTGVQQKEKGLNRRAESLTEMETDSFKKCDVREEKTGQLGKDLIEHSRKCFDECDEREEKTEQLGKGLIEHSRKCFDECDEREKPLKERENKVFKKEQKQGEIQRQHEETYKKLKKIQRQQDETQKKQEETERKQIERKQKLDLQDTMLNTKKTGLDKLRKKVLEMKGKQDQKKKEQDKKDITQTQRDEKLEEKALQNWDKEITNI